MKEIRKNRNKNIIYSIIILILLIISPFCFAILYPNNIILIIAMLLFSLGLILGIATLYKVDYLNKRLKEQEQ